jgi:hypothetical protein
MRKCGDEATAADGAMMAGYPYQYPDPYSPAPPPVAPVPPRPQAARLLIPALIGAAVAVGLGVYGRAHDPAGVETDFGFKSVIAMKVWFASGAGQLVLAAWAKSEAVSDTHLRLPTT